VSLPLPLPVLALLLAGVAGFSLPAGRVAAQQSPPAAGETPSQTQPPTQPAAQDDGELVVPWPAQTWQAPAIRVEGEPLPELREEERIGPYGQPRWTTRRRFPTVRAYVVPEGEIEAEYWLRVDEPKDGSKKYLHQYEVEIGLPNRFQLDFYLNSKHTGTNQPFDINEQSIEGRYAFADWGEIWGNPTLYLEFINRIEESEKVESKLLLAGEAAPSWHWAANLIAEQETGGEQERELGFTYGLAKSVVDEKLSVGTEFKFAHVNTKEDRSDFTDEFLLGPSVQWRPSQRSHVLFTPLFGMGGESPDYQMFFIMGWEF